MWYKDEAHSSHTYAADSPDLRHWTVDGEVIGGKGHEGPNVFTWKNQWWMITDHWDGLGVFRSADALRWTRQANNILREPGTRPDDGVKGGHADVLVQGADAWIFYFTHPGRVPAAGSTDRYLRDAAHVDSGGETGTRRHRGDLPPRRAFPFPPRSGRE